MPGDAITRAIEDAGVEAAAVAALYLGNMTAGVLERQQQLASLCAHACGLTCAEAFTLEASSASGAAALRTGYVAVAGGFHDVVEAVQQLRGAAGANQVRNAAVAMTQNLGGMGATAITHVLEAT